MFRTYSTLFLIAAAMVLGSTDRAESKEPQDAENVSKFMRAKLVHSQKVLEALALEDYEQIAKHSQELSLLTQAAVWQVIQTPEYVQHSVEFRRAADALTDAAKKKNIDGAGLAYVEVTLKCINCHKYVRNTKMAAVPAEPKIGSVLTR